MPLFLIIVTIFRINHTPDMSKRFVLTIILLLTLLLPSHAVLKERDIAGTLAMLRIELTNYHTSLERQSDYMKEQRLQVMKQLVDALNKSQQNALMLYSQKNGYVFDLTYACHEATEQYQDFRHNAGPFRTFVSNADIEISRYDSLINDLSSMYVDALSPRSKIDRNVCLTLAVNIRHTLNDNRTQIQQYIDLYNTTETRLKYLNDYANKRYTDIQASIFTNRGEDYFSILRRLHHEVKETTQTIIEKYKPQQKYHSDWDSRIIIGLLVMIFIVGFVASGINYLTIGLVMTWLMKRDKAESVLSWMLGSKRSAQARDYFKAKRGCIIMTATVITFALILGIVRVAWTQNFIIMACSLLVGYAWLLGVILFSLLIRLDGGQMKAGYRIYAPIMLVCFVVITFRIVLAPNDFVNLVFPPVLLCSTVWQWLSIRRCGRKLPASDAGYAYISLAVFLASDVASLAGYTLFAVELLIWWTIQLACILTITCISNMLKQYANNPKRLYLSAETPINRSWLFLLIYKVILPSLGALSVLVAIYWAADVFNLSDTTWRIFNEPLVKTTKITLSILHVEQVLILFFIFSYLNHTAISSTHYHLSSKEKRRAAVENRKANDQAVVSQAAMWRNVVQVLVWGIWLLTAMTIFNINNTWLVAISAGLSTGIGFAMKDILENIYYGISLMAGRIKVGDFISIEGTRGTVKSISYVSTTIEALDGSIIAFQNAQLFAKNYKNLTRNHGNELAIIPVGVAYGTNAAFARQIIGDAVKAIERHNYIKFIQVIFTGFGDNSIDFKILAWVDSRKQVFAESDIMEAVYNALNDNNIEIPFPQRDIHIIGTGEAFTGGEKASGKQHVEHADNLDEAMKKINRTE